MKWANSWAFAFLGGLAILALIVTGGAWAAPPRESSLAVGPISFTVDLEWQTEQVLSSGHKFPQGVLFLCAYWTYRGATLGAPYKFAWYRNGLVIGEGNATWPAEHGEARLYWRKPDGYPLDPGVYALVLETGGQTHVSNPPALVEAEDSGSGRTPRCGPLRFRRGFSESSTRIMMAGTRYAQGTTEVIAQWTCRRMPVGRPYRVTWSQGTRLFYDDHGIIDYDLTGWGPYEIQIDTGGEVLLTGTCTILDSEGPAYGPVVFSSAFDEEAWQPVHIAKQFDYGVKALYAYWAFRNAPVGTSYRSVWHLDGALINESEEVFGVASGRAWRSVSRQDGAPMKRGVYVFNVFVDEAVVVADQCTVR